MMINPTSPCVDCGKPIDNGHWYYGKGRGGAGKDGYHHSTCGDPLGIEAAVAAERERCAKIADEVQKSMHEECDFGAGMVAKAIRAQAGHG